VVKQRGTAGNAWGLALILCGLLCPGRAAAAPPEPLGPYLGPFADVPLGHWALDAVNEMASRGFVHGYPDGQYRGARGMTRYEVAVAVRSVMGETQVTDPPPRMWPETKLLGPAPTDVPKEHWAADSVDVCRKWGIFAGEPSAVFAGDRAMSRYEFCLVLKRLGDWVFRFAELMGKYGRQGRPPPLPADAPVPRLVWPPRESRKPVLKDVPRRHWAADVVAFERDWGVILGYPGARLEGNREITRYEFALGLQRLFVFQQRILDFQHRQRKAGVPGLALVASW
jgi:hypothetical protein